MAEDAARFGYERVIAGILQTIRSQDLGVGAKLPTYPEIQEQYRVSSTTARYAVRELKGLGVIASKQGSGLFVADPSKVAEVQDAKDEELRTSVDALRRQLYEIGSRLAHVEEQLQQLQPPPADAESQRQLP